MFTELIGQGSYDPAAPDRVYFSIGAAVAAIALLLAFTQLIKPIIKFRLNTGLLKPFKIIVLFFFAILFVLIAAILPFVPGPSVWILGYPFFWEFVAGFLIVLLSVIVLWKINRPIVFNKRISKYFLKTCTSFIAKGDESELRELADEIYHSVEEIVKACKKYNSWDASFAKKDGKKYEISEYTRDALSMLDLLSDDTFCKLMVCHVPGTAYEIFYQITQQKLYYSAGYALVNQLIKQALENRESILYKEKDYCGLGHFKLFTNLVFSDSELIESNLRPLQAWSHWRDENLEIWKINKYMDILKVATQAYITSGWQRGHASGLYCGFGNATNIAMSESIKLSRVLDDFAYDSNHFKNLSAIGDGLREIVLLLSKHEKDIPEYQFNEAKYDFYHDCSLYGVVAKGIYEYFEHLSTIRTKDEHVRMLAIHLWMSIYFPLSSNQESKAVDEIQKRLNIHLLKKFEENLKELFYPALTRLWINLAGFQDRDESGESYVNGKLYELLRKYYEKAVKTDAEKASHMIPDKVRYDKEKGQLIQTWPSGSTTEFNLREK